MATKLVDRIAGILVFLMIIGVFVAGYMAGKGGGPDEIQRDTIYVAQPPVILRDTSFVEKAVTRYITRTEAETVYGPIAVADTMFEEKSARFEVELSNDEYKVRTIATTKYAIGLDLFDLAFDSTTISIPPRPEIVTTEIYQTPTWRKVGMIGGGATTALLLKDENYLAAGIAGGVTVVLMLMGD